MKLRMMNIILRKTLLLAGIAFSVGIFAQKRMFQVPVKRCSVPKICTDCADKAPTVEAKSFGYMIATLNKNVNFTGVKANTLRFQVIYDSEKRTACVVSHNDDKEYSFTKAIINELNNYGGYRPAYKNGNRLRYSNIIILMDVRDYKLYGGVAGEYESNNYDLLDEKK